MAVTQEDFWDLLRAVGEPVITESQATWDALLRFRRASDELLKCFQADEVRGWKKEG